MMTIWMVAADYPHKLQPFFNGGIVGGITVSKSKVETYHLLRDFSGTDLRYRIRNDCDYYEFALRRSTRFQAFIAKLTRKENTMLYLYFVTEKDEPGKEGEPLLASAGRDPEDSWAMLATNRQRMSGEPQNAAELKRRMTAEGYHVEKYSATPL